MAQQGTAEPRTSGRTFELACAAVALVVGFRAGLLPGGLVGVDVALALFGWWLGGAQVRPPSLADRLRTAWRRVWPPMLAGVAVACAWVLVTGPTRYDARVRGMALGAFGGYGNWHLLAVGPAEAARTRLATPLQGWWPLAVAAQLVLVLAALRWATRPRAGRRPDQRDPLVLVAVVAAALAEVVGLAGVLAGWGAQAVLLSTASHAPAFFLGVAVGSLRPGPQASTIRAVAEGVRWPAAALLVLAAAVAPTSSLATAVALVAPLLAAALVAAEVPWPEPVAPRRAARPPVEGWALLVAAAIVVGPCLALVHSAWSTFPTVVVDVAGLAIAALVAYASAAVASRLSDRPEAVDRRVVLVPPIAVGLVVALFAATGAFHWTSPRPRAAPVPAVGSADRGGT